MRVRDLIKFLEEQDQDLPVLVCGNGTAKRLAEVDLMVDAFPDEDGNHEALFVTTWA